jgi:DNA-binding PadR family transcriptional regulator
VSWPFRITPPLLAVVDTLVRTSGKIHGWGIAERCGETTPNVYRALERLRLAGWVTYEWEAENPNPTLPRRRLYQLTAEGWRHAPALLNERATNPRWTIRPIGETR